MGRGWVEPDAGSNSAEGLAEGFSNFQATGLTPNGMTPAGGQLAAHQTIQESMRLIMLVRAYQVSSLLLPPLPARAACAPRVPQSDGVQRLALRASR
jgi:hypothetical protein